MDHARRTDRHAAGEGVVILPVVRFRIGVRRLALLLAGSCFMLTCQAGGGPGDPMVAQSSAADGSSPYAISGDPGWPAADTARRAFAEVGRVDSTAARLAISTEITGDGRTLVHLDRVVIGDDAWLCTLLQREGISTRTRDESVVIDAGGVDGPRAAVRSVLHDINEAIERVRGNIVAQRRVGHRASIGSLEMRIIDPQAQGPSERIVDVSQGPLVQTDQSLDVAIYGRGFFTVELPGEKATRFTRDGRFIRSPAGALALAAWPGAVLCPRVDVPADVRGLEIKPDGSVWSQGRVGARPEPVGRIGLSEIEHPEQLTPDIGGLYVANARAGKIREDFPTEGDFGELYQGRLELSNVDFTRAWAQLCRLEDARQIALAIIAKLNDDASPASFAHSQDEARRKRMRGDPESFDTVLIPYVDPPIGRRESELVGFLQARGIGYSLEAEGVNVHRGETEAAALSDYLVALRVRMDDLARTIAAESDAQRDSEPSAASGVSLELHMAEADTLAAEYDQIKSASCALGGKAVASLVRLLGESPAVVRSDAAWILGRIGPEARSAVPALVDRLAAADGRLRSIAAASLLRIAPGSRPVIDSIVDMWIAALHSPVRSERYHAAIALSRMGQSAAAAAPVLATMVNDPDGGAALALGRIGPAAAIAVPALTKALVDPSAMVRLRAAEALGGIGAASRTALPILVTLFGDPDVDVRTAAVEAVGEIGPIDSAQLDALAALLKDGDSGVRDAATEALAKLAPTNEEARAILFAQSDSPTDGPGIVTEISPQGLWGMMKDLMARADVRSRLILCNTIGALGSLAKPAVGILLELAHDNRECVVCSALAAIDSLGCEARAAVSDLSMILQHENPLIRVRAATALGSIGADAAMAVPALCSRFDDDDDAVVVAVVEALGRIGPPAEDCLPLLRDLGEHENPRIREAVCQTVNRIQSACALTKSNGNANERRIAVDSSSDDAEP